MKIKMKPYDGSEIELIRKMLETQANEGHPLDYEVRVDNKPVIYRTSNVERFATLHDFILEDSFKLSIVVYHPTAGKTFYKFSLQPETEVEEEPVNGVPDVEKTLSERIALYEERSEAKRLKEKLEQTEKQLREAEDYIDDLTEQIKTMQVKPNHLGEINLPSLLGGLFEQIVMSNPKVMENVPVLNGIARGISESQKDKKSMANPGFEGDVSFRPKGQGEQTAAPDERTADALRLYDFLQVSFNPLQRLLISTIIEVFAKNPQEVTTVAELLNIELTDEGEQSD